MRILGIDPGSLTTGYGIIEEKNSSILLVEYGCIRTNPKATFPNRLARIYDSLCQIIKDKGIKEISVEKAFYAKNVHTTLILGHARGVILLAAEHNGANIFEYAPKEIKKSVSGNGSASKEQVEYMVQKLLNIKEKITPLDASDAIATAICHLNRRRFL